MDAIKVITPPTGEELLQEICNQIMKGSRFVTFVTNRGKTDFVIKMAKYEDMTARFVGVATTDTVVNLYASLTIVTHPDYSSTPAEFYVSK